MYRGQGQELGLGLGLGPDEGTRIYAVGLLLYLYLYCTCTYTYAHTLIGSAHPHLCSKTRGARKLAMALNETWRERRQWAWWAPLRRRAPEPGRRSDAVRRDAMPRLLLRPRDSGEIFLGVARAGRAALW